MHQNKVLRLIESLNPVEFKGFNRFLQSPYFNTNPRIVLFYDQLKKYYPAFDSPKLEREKLFKKLFPGKKYHYQQLANLISQFTRLTEEYFVQLELKANTLEHKKNLLKSYSNRDLYDLFEKDSSNQIGLLKKNPPKNLELNVFLLLKQKYFHPFTNKKTIDTSLLELLMTNLDNFYWKEKLALTSEIKNKASILNSDLDIPLLKEIKAIVKEQKDNHSLYIYFLLLELLEHKKIEEFKKLKSYFLENINNINRELRLIIFRSLNNYCSQSINIGKTAFFNEQFELYQFGLKENLVLNNNVISSAAFINIVFTTIRHKIENKKWVADFIENYQSNLNPSIKHEVVSLSHAYIHYVEEDYKKVIEELISFKSDDVSRIFTTKKILIRTYFELFLRDSSYYELFLSSCLAFEKVLYRNKAQHSTRIESNLNFIVIIKKIAKKILEDKFDPIEKQRLAEEINTKKHLISRYWFIDRIKHLN